MTIRFITAFTEAVCRRVRLCTPRGHGPAPFAAAFVHVTEVGLCLKLGISPGSTLSSVWITNCHMNHYRSMKCFRGAGHYHPGWLLHGIHAPLLAISVKFLCTLASCPFYSPGHVHARCSVGLMDSWLVSRSVFALYVWPSTPCPGRGAMSRVAEPPRPS